ncbi:MAG: PEP-CTERM sorting domain-containing protein [Gemmatimonadaceae bacterium]
MPTATSRFTSLSLALLMSSVITASASAQVLGTLTFQGDLSANGQIAGVEVGPYRADLAGFAPLLADASNTPVWCLDFARSAPPLAAPYAYWATPILSGDLTRIARPADLLTYQRAAWLVEQQLAGVSGFTELNVQGTIWRLFDPGAPATGYADLSGLLPLNPLPLARDWFILTEQGDPECRSCTAHQEFLVPVNTVPEPSTILLTAAGGLAMAAVTRRRRRQHVG